MIYHLKFNIKKICLIFFLPFYLNAQNPCLLENLPRIKAPKDTLDAVMAYTNLAACYGDRLMMDSANYYAREGEKLALKSKEKLGLGFVYLRFSEIEMATNNYLSAINNINKADYYFEKSNNIRGKLFALLGLMRINIILKDNKTIHKDYETGIHLSNEVKSEYIKAQFNAILVGYYRQPENVKADSVLYYTNLFEKNLNIVAKKISVNEEFIDAKIWKSFAYNYSGKWDISFKNLVIAKKEAISLKYENGIKEINNLIFEIYLKKKNIAACEYLKKEILLSKNYDEEYFKNIYKLDSLKNDYKNALINYQIYKYKIDSSSTISYKKIINNLKANVDLKITKGLNTNLVFNAQDKENQLFRQKTYLIVSILFSLIIGLSLWQYFRNKTKKQKLIFAKTNLENELRLIKNQLNPHFVQNAFNTLSINMPDSTAGQKNKDYLRQLSTYFRRVLDITYIDSHSLEAELEFSEEYLKLQQQIVANKFDYSIAIDDNFDTYSLKVPTMILQPFLENCIKHGFNGIDYKGEIIVKCLFKDELPFIEIIDNGKGGINDDFKRGGYGTSISQKRLALFFENKINSIEINNRIDGKGCLVRIPVLKIIN